MSQRARDRDDDNASLLRPPANRSAIPSFIVMDVMRAAAEQKASGQSIVHMEVGQPATAAPRAALDAVARALHSETLGYTLALGVEPLRARIAALYRERHGLEIAPERVIVTTGSSGAFVLAFLALFDAGATVALPSPGYPCYRHILSALGIHSAIVETGPQTRWMPTAAAVAALADGKGIDGLLIASPANPTGTMLTPDRMKELAALCRARKIWFISDEIYHGLAYDGIEDTALRYSDDVIVINSFSKFFSMTGWRVGWMVVPKALVRTVERIAQNLFISPPAVSQFAALGAFDAIDELAANKRTYADNRALLLRELPDLGFGALAPADGAFYLYADVSALTDDSRAFAEQMLRETGVACTPGLDFDEARGHRYLRFSYAGSTGDMEEAVRRLRKWTRK